MPTKPTTHRLNPKTRRARDHRQSASRRGYDRTWRKVAQNKLGKDPLCEHCLEFGKTIAAQLPDHIVPLDKGGKRLDETNLQSLCRTCHSYKTSRELSYKITVITGAPCAGKSHLAMQLAGEKGLIWDSDALLLSMNMNWDDVPSDTVMLIKPLLRAFIDRLIRRRVDRDTFIIVGDRMQAEDTAELICADLQVVDPGIKECIKRAKRDIRRQHRVQEVIEAIEVWYSNE